MLVITGGYVFTFLIWILPGALTDAKVPGTFLLTTPRGAVAVGPDAMATLSDARNSAFWLPHMGEKAEDRAVAVPIPPGFLVSG